MRFCIISTTLVALTASASVVHQGPAYVLKVLYLPVGVLFAIPLQELACLSGWGSGRKGPAPKIMYYVVCTYLNDAPRGRINPKK